MKAFWKLFGYACLAVLILIFLYIGFIVEEVFEEWAKDAMPFLAYVGHTAQWIFGVWFLCKLATKLGKLWDKHQDTLNVLLTTSQETIQHLRRLRAELEERENQQLLETTGQLRRLRDELEERDNRQREALLVASEQTTEHLRRLREDAEGRDNQQRRFSWS